MSGLFTFQHSSVLLNAYIKQHNIMTFWILRPNASFTPLFYLLSSLHAFIALKECVQGPSRVLTIYWIGTNSVLTGHPKDLRPPNLFMDFLRILS